MDKDAIAKAIKVILTAIGEDPDREGLRDTPRRVAAMLEEVLHGYAPGTGLAAGLEPLAPDPGGPTGAGKVPVRAASESGIVVLRNIPLYSFCEHHLLPFMGHAHLAYLPEGGRLAGFSDLTRLVDRLARRLQLQERLTEEIADALMAGLRPRGALVVVEAEQLCVTMRDTEAHGTRAVTSAARGGFARNPSLRQEALALVTGASARG